MTGYCKKSKKQKKTSKFALVFLMLIGFGVFVFLFNEYYLENQNIIYNKIKASIYNLVKKTYNKSENIDFAQNAKHEPVLIWCRIENCYLIDQNGIIIKEYNPLEILDLIKIKEQIKEPLEVNQKFIDLETINFIKNIDQNMLAKTNIQPIEYFTPDIKTNHLEIISSDDKKFIFNTKNNLQKQFLIIKQTLKQLNSDQKKNLKYIGVDVDSQVYYMLE